MIMTHKLGDMPYPLINVTYNSDGDVEICIGSPYLADKNTVYRNLQTFCILLPNTWWPLHKRVESCINSAIALYFKREANVRQSWCMD